MFLEKVRGPHCPVYASSENPQPGGTQNLVGEMIPHGNSKQHHIFHNHPAQKQFQCSFVASSDQFINGLDSISKMPQDHFLLTIFHGCPTILPTKISPLLRFKSPLLKPRPASVTPTQNLHRSQVTSPVPACGGHLISLERMNEWLDRWNSLAGHLKSPTI